MNGKMVPFIINLSFIRNSESYVRLHERFINPQFLKKLPVYKIMDDLLL